LKRWGNEVETSARNAALEEGCPNAEYASLEELADMLPSALERGVSF
jgi:hypothetical protein